MCYVVFLSTTSSEDLSPCSNEYIRFEKDLGSESAASRLLHANKWYVGSLSGCSCTFRHLMAPDLGFGRPVDWYPEEADTLEATRCFVAVVRRLVDEEHEVDCVDAWSGTAADAILEKRVALSDVADDEFRFFENYHFQFAALRRPKRRG